MQQKTTSLVSSHIGVGSRFSFDIFDAKGHVLLPRGNLVSSAQQASSLRQNGRRITDSPKTASSFAVMARIAERLTNLYRDVTDGLDQGPLRIKQIRNLATDFIEIADHDPDASFASIHLDIHHSYLVVHSLMSAMVCARLSITKEWNEKDRISLISAALTHDIGMLDFYKEVSIRAELTPTDIQSIKGHASNSVRILRAYGVDDPVWLDSVLEHHEHLDGKGYYGKKGAEITPGGRIMSLADTYSAMLRPRPYRERVIAREALQTLYSGQSANRYDLDLLAKLIWDFGFYPPGSLLRLANQEMAVAIRNTPGVLDNPLVASITDEFGRALLTPVLRDTKEEQFRIDKTLDPSMSARAGRMLESCWAHHHHTTQ